jgi:DNA-binding FadR family transcriptional regulator
MPRMRRASRTLEKVELRAAGMKAIDPQLSFGNSLTLSEFIQLIEELRLKTETYNTALAVIDASQTEIAELEKTLNEMAEKLLIGVAYTYGNDSREYEMAGGVRKSERIRRSSKNRIRSTAANSSNNGSTTV